MDFEIICIAILGIIVGFVSIISPKTTITNKIKNEKIEKAKRMIYDDDYKTEEEPFSLIPEEDKATYTKKEIRDSRLLGVFIIFFSIVMLRLYMLGYIGY